MTRYGQSSCPSFSTLIGAGGGDPSSREGRGHIGDEEDEAPQPSGGQQERSVMGGTKIRTEVSLPPPQEPVPQYLRRAIDVVASYRLYKGIVNYTAKQGYRADLRQEAVARASAIRQLHRPKKDVPEKKLRGSKARKAAEKESSS